MATKGRSTRVHTKRDGQSQDDQKPNLWIFAGLAGSLVLLAAVYIFYPAPTSNTTSMPVRESVPEAGRTRDGGQQPSTKVDTPTVATVEQPKPLQLPVTAREFNVKSEQETLLADVERVAKEYPSSAVAMHVAAITYAELLLTDQADTHFKRSLELDANAPQVLVDYAGLLMQVGKQQEVVELLREPVKRPNADPRMHVALGRAYAETGDLEESDKGLRAAAELFPKNPDIRLALAQTQLQLQQFAEAAENSQSAIDLGSTDNAVYTTLSSALARLGRREEAMEVRGRIAAPTQQAAEKDEQYRTSFKAFASHTYTMLANVHRANGDVDEAEKCLMESLEIEPNYATSLVGLADLLYQRQRRNDAITVYQRLLKVQPENITNYNNLASLAVTIGNLDLADDVLKRASEHDPTANATLCYADFLLRTGRPVEAIAYAETSVKTLGNADAYLVLMSAQQANGDVVGAVLTLQKARAAWPNDARLKNQQF